MTMDEMDCEIYVDGPDREGLTARILEITGGTRDGRHVNAGDHELYVDENDEADPARAAAFPDGFLHFALNVEVYPTSPPAIALVTLLLETFWAAGWAAVAACDYETDLPHGGGYRSRDVPWPTA
jgi:hypothetical protein